MIMNKRHAFTLIEMLVVIAIIGIIAALVVNMNSGAQTAKRNAMVNADKAKLTLAIDSYQSKLNFYPPDNGYLINASTISFSFYDATAATNPLIYELTGASNLTSGIQLFDGSINSSANFTSVFGRSAVNNANADEPHNFFIPQSKEYTNYSPTNLNLYGLLVPVSLLNNPSFHNFWHYDSSTTNRHNPASYDLWAEYVSSSKNGVDVITTNGNW
jgi:prepilin-type N-terminal cleavage/methylation domain-containing protein